MEAEEGGGSPAHSDDTDLDDDEESYEEAPGDPNPHHHHHFIFLRSKKKKPKKIREGQGPLDCLLSFFQRLFQFRIQPEPISFFKPSQFTDSGKFIPERKDKEEENRLEEEVNFDTEMKVNMILVREEYERLQVKEANDPGGLPGGPKLSSEKIQILRVLFRSFDINEDGLVEFRELNEVLNELGDKTPEGVRRQLFDSVDVEKNGFIDFVEFIKFCRSVERFARSKNATADNRGLADTLRMIEGQMAQLNGLDPVQQLQSGLF